MVGPQGFEPWTDESKVGHASSCIRGLFQGRLALRPSLLVREIRRSISDRSSRYFTAHSGLIQIYLPGRMNASLPDAAVAASVAIPQERRISVIGRSRRQDSGHAQQCAAVFRRSAMTANTTKSSCSATPTQM